MQINVNSVISILTLNHPGNKSGVPFLVESMILEALLVTEAAEGPREEGPGDAVGNPTDALRARALRLTSSHD